MRRLLATVSFAGFALISSSALAETTSGSDHSTVVGHMGVGWFGVSTIQDGQSGSVTAPVVGIRYWLNDGMGVDVGLGLGYHSSSTSVESGGQTTDTDGPSSFGVLLHGGVPIALHTGAHYVFTLTPELNLGLASGSEKSQSAELSHSGYRFEIGARAGAEVQFGFIGIPELSLEASIGLFLTKNHGSTETKPNGGGATSTAGAGNFSLTTSALNNPWDFFTTSVAARYYF